MEFNEYGLRAAFQGKKIGCPLYFFDRAESTNSLIFGLAEEGAPEGTLVIADRQTNGRGRMKRSWHSPPGVNLYSSVILKPDIDPSAAPAIALMAGVAVAELLTVYCPSTVHLKWPNDVLVGGKKICGVLSEIKISGKKIMFVILGIGININMQSADFDPSLGDTATSLREEAKRMFSRVEVAVKLFDNISKYYDIFTSSGFAPIKEKWLCYSPMVGRDCEVLSGHDLLRGKVAGIDDGGALVMVDDDGRAQRILAGDASIVKG